MNNNREKIKMKILFMCCFLPPLTSYGQVEAEEKQISKNIPREILQKSRELRSSFIYYPAPFKRVAAVRNLEKHKQLEFFSVLTDEVAKDLVGTRYSNTEGKIPILVSWHYFEEEKIDLKYVYAGSSAARVWIHESSIYVQALHSDLIIKKKKIECPIIILVDKAPKKVTLYSMNTGW